MSQFMGQTIDSKIVEMSFNNQNFEQNAKQSISTLDKLKSALNFDSAIKGFAEIDNASKKVSFAGISSGIEQLTQKFSFLGSFARRITENMADDVYSVVRNAVNKVASLPNQAWSLITQGGKARAMGIENSRFMLQGLFPDNLDEVEKIMADAMDSVDGTAYAFDSAAQAASQFAASGLTAGEQMQKALKGITGVAAMTNSEYEYISQIFTTVAGNGKLMGDQLLQLSGRGLNAASTMAKFFNEVTSGSEKAANVSEAVKEKIKELSKGAEVTEGDIRDFVSKSKISFDIFSEAMSTSFGEHAKKANETLTGSLANMKAALKKIGAKFYTPLIEQNGPLVEMFNALRIKINEVNKAIDPLVNLLSSGVIKGIETITNLVNSIDFQHSGLKAFLDALQPKSVSVDDLFGLKRIKGSFAELDKETSTVTGKLKLLDDTQGEFISRPEKLQALEAVFAATARAHGIAIDDMIEKEGSFTATLKNGWLTTDLYNEALKSVKDIIKGNGEAAVKTEEDLNKIREAALGVIRGDYGNDMNARFAKLAEEGFDPQTVQDYVNALREATGGTWDLSEAAYEAADAAIKAGGSIEGMTDEQLASAGYTEDQIAALRELEREAKDAGMSLSEYLGVEGVTDVKSGAQLLLESLQNVMSGLGKVFKNVGKAWTSVFPTTTAETITGIIDKIHKFSEGLLVSNKTALRIRKTFHGLFTALSIVGNVFKAIAGPVITAFGNAFSFVFDKILTYGTKFNRWIKGVKKNLEESGAYEKISNALSTAFDKLGKAMAFVWNAVEKLVGTGIKKIPEWFDAFTKLPIVQRGLARFKSIIEKVKNAIKGVDDGSILYKIVEKLKSVKDAILSLFGKGSGEDSVNNDNFFTTVIDKLKQLPKIIGGIAKFAVPIGLFGGAIFLVVSAVRKILRLKNAVKNLVANVSDVFGNIVKGNKAEILNTQATAVLKIAAAIGIVALAAYELSKVDPARLWSAVGAITIISGIVLAILVTLNRFMATANQSKSLAGNLEDIIRNLAGKFSDALLKNIKSKTLLNNAKALALFAASIGIVAGSIYALAQLDVGKMWSAVGAIVVITAMIVGIFVLLRKLTSTKTEKSGIKGFVESLRGLVDSKALLSGATAMLIFASAIAVIAAAVYKLSELESGKLWSAVGAIAVLTAILVGVMAITKYLSKGADNSGGDVEALLRSAGIFAIAEALKSVVEALNAVKVNKNIWAKLAVIVTLIATLTAANILLSKYSGDSATSAAALVAFAAVIFGVSALVGSINKLKAGKNLLTKLLAVEVLLLTLTGIVIVLNEAAFDDKGSIAGLAAFAAIIFGVSFLVGSINKLKADNALLPKLVVVEILLASLTGIVLILNKVAFADKGNIAGLAAFAAIIIGVAVLVNSINSLRINKNIVTKILIVELLLASLLGVTLILNKVALSGKGSVAGLASFAAIVIGVAVLVNSINKLKVNRGIWTKIAIVEILLVSLLGVTLIISKFAGGAGNIGAALMVAMLAVAVSVIAGSLAKLSEIETDKLMDAAKVLAAIIAAVTGMGAVIGLIGPSITSMLGVAILVGMIGHVIGKLAKIPAKKMRSALTGIERFFTALSKTMVVISAVGLLGGAAMTGVVAALALVGGLALIVGLLGGFVGGGVAAFGKAVTSALPQMGLDLSAFGVAIMPFIAAFNSINPGAFDNFKALAESLVDIAKGEFLSAIYKLFSGGKSPITQFADEMPELARALNAYASALSSDINMEKVNTSIAATQMLASLARNDIPEGGVIGWLKGNASKISDFGNQLPDLAKGLSTYANAIDSTTFNDEKIQASISLAEMLSALTNDSIPEGGVIGWLKGNASKISDFGNQLPDLANGLATYANKIDSATFSSDKIEASTNLASILASLSKNEIQNAGVIGWFTGSDEKITNFANQLPDLATGLVGYMTAIGGETFDNVDASTNLATVLAALCKNDIPDGGVLGWFTGNDEKITNFANQLPGLATGLKGFAQEIGEETFDNTDAAANLAKMLASLASEDIPAGGIVGWFTGNDEKITNFASQLPDLGAGLAGFAKSIAGENFSGTKKVANLASMLASLASEDIPDGGIVGWFTGNDEKITNFASQLPDLGAGLAAFAKSIADEDFNGTKKVANLATMLASLASEDIPAGGIVGWFTGSDTKIKNFADQLPDLGAGLAGFAASISGQTFDNADSVKGLATMLGELANKDIGSGGIVGWFTGNDSKIKNFADQLPGLAVGLKGFAQEIGDETFDNTAGAQGLAKMLGELASEDIPDGGIVGWFTGNDSKIENFAAQLPGLAVGLKGFAQELGDEKFENTDAAANLAKMLGELASEDIPAGGVLGWLEGNDSNISLFAGQLPALADGLKSYAETLSGSSFSDDDVTASTNLAKMLAAMANEDIPAGGIIGWIEGNATKIEDFAKQLPKLAEGLSSFADNLGDNITNTDKINGARSLLDAMGTFNEGITNLAYIDQSVIDTFGQKLENLALTLDDFTGHSFNAKKLNAVAEALTVTTTMNLTDGDINDDSKVTSFSEHLGSLRTAIESLVGIDTSGVDKMKEAAEKANATNLSSQVNDSKELKKSGAAMGQETAEGVKEAAGDMSSAAAALSTAASSALSDTGSFRQAGLNMMGAVAGGIYTAASIVTSAAASVASQAADAVSADTSSAGLNFVSGFANGVIMNIYIATAAAARMAQMALDTINAKFRSASPSRETMKIGGWFGQGLAIGIGKETEHVSKVAGLMGDAALKTLDDTIGAVTSIFGQEIDAQPVITPVLDLTEIQNGALAMGNMLAFNDPIAVTGNLNAISANMYNRGATNDDLLYALSSLQRTFEANPREANTYIVDGVTYDDGSNITDAVRTLVNATVVQRRS